MQKKYKEWKPLFLAKEKKAIGNFTYLFLHPFADKMTLLFFFP